MHVYRSSRPTIMSGEVVTFATGFNQSKGVFGPSYEPTGPFDVSASRDAVIVHRAECRDAESVAALCLVLEEAAQAMACLNARGFCSGSLYPREPTATSTERTTC